MGDRWSFPHQASAATYVWLPLRTEGEKLSIPAYWECWDVSTVEPVVPLHGGISVSREKWIVREPSEWEWEKGSFASPVKGSFLEFSFRGKQAVIVGKTTPEGGYAKVSVTGKDQKVIWSSLIDFYSKETSDGVRCMTPLLTPDEYTLKIEVTGISPVWIDKNQNRFGSTDCKVVIGSLVYFN